MRGQGGLDVEIALNDLLASLVDALRRTRTDCLGKIVLGIACAGFGADAEDRGEDRGLEYRAPVLVDAVFNTAIALSVAARKMTEINRISIRENQSCPNHLDAGLTERNLTIDFALEHRPLGDKQIVAGRPNRGALANEPE